MTLYELIQELEEDEDIQSILVYVEYKDDTNEIYNMDIVSPESIH